MSKARKGRARSSDLEMGPALSYPFRALKRGWVFNLALLPWVKALWGSGGPAGGEEEAFGEGMREGLLGHRPSLLDTNPRIRGEPPPSSQKGGAHF
jgi:hypothetical protein